MPDFAPVASTFELYRSFPPGVAEAIHIGVRKASGNSRTARALDVGAGTGRVGRAFEAASDFYIGVDASYEMLREFRRYQAEARLVQADGSSLPFRDGAFELVLLIG